MRKNANYQYYVEGEDEKKLLEVLKKDLKYIASGKIDKFNVVQNLITPARIRPLKTGTVVVLIYDTDVENVQILRQNIVFLKKQSGIKEVVCIPQTNNLEDELEYCCQIKRVEELTNTETLANHKREFISCSNLNVKLEKYKFDIAKLWSRIPQNKFKEFGNDAGKIKL